MYRQTPDARAIESGAPGIHWQPDSAHTVRSQIAFNQDLDSVRKWSPAGASSGYYAANTVVVETTTDENGNQVKTFVNALGQTVLKKVQHDVSKWLKTYYVYDEYGRLRYQVPPRAVGLLDGTPDLVNDTNLAELIYRYDYDNRDRVIAKRIPGATDEEYLVYDKLDRVVLTQDGNLKNLGKWMFIKYDYYGRPAYSGLLASNDTRATLQTALNNEDYSQSGVKWYETEAAGATDYSNQAYPRSNTTVLTVNYYDHYDFNRNGTADYSFDGSHLDGQETTALATARGSATGSRRRTINAAGDTTSVWLKSVIFYGAYDRVIQTLSNNHLYTTLADTTTVIYNFAGQVLKSKTTHSSSATVSVSFVDRPVYDHAGRVVKQYRNINNSQDDQLVAEYQYNKLGQVVDKKLHDSGSGVFLQSVDYRYNIRGWLTSINNAQLTSDGTLNNDTGDYFGMELAYQQGIAGMGVSKQYNGNVSAVKWRSFGTTGAADQRSYKFSYDKSDRLTGSTFQASTYVSSTVYWDKEVNTLNETLTYDANGNIKTLVRKRNSRGLSGGEVTSTAQTIDDLSYQYEALDNGTKPTNRLARVNEAVTGTTGDAGFKNGASSDTEFTYSAWGSATKDENKGISAIDYNVLGKARRVTYTSGKVVEYTYDAAGTKLTMKVLQGATVESLTSYVGGFVYEGATPALSFFASPEGRVVKNGSSYEYQYSISDHQGNTRVVFSSVAPAASEWLATFELPQTYGFSMDTTKVVTFNSANHTAGGKKVFRMNQGNPVGPARSLRVYPGDSVKAEVWAYYEASSGYGTDGVALATAIAAAFGGVSGGGGESGSIFEGVNSALGGFAAGGSPDDEEPPAYLNYILFDQQYKVLDAGWKRIPTSANFAKQKVALDAKYITEAGYYFTYLSYEGESNNFVYFDDYKVRHVKSRLIQGNEYYPFGMQTANSWTRESVTGNNYLANGGTELNATTQLYDLEFRNYDPALGRMFQVDPVAAKYASLTPYNYSFNNPIAFADPSGADPDPDYQNPNHQYYFHNGAGSAGYPGLTYDDVVPQSARGEFNSAFGWRQDVMLGWFGGGGQSLNAGSFAYQARLYAYQDRLHKAQAMAGAVTDALNGPDGETYMTVSGGRITSREFKSTLQLQREWGSEIARGYYGGDGRMPAGLSPANQFFGQVVGMLPQTQGGPETWYYMSRDGMPHGMVYDPTGGYIYEINEVPRGMGVLEQLEILILNSVPSNNVKAKISVAYQYKQGSPEWDKLWAREKGNTYLLSPVTVTNPAAATAWFQGQTGNAWNYSLGANNCAHYSVQGLNAGGAGVYLGGSFPSSFPIAPTMTWTAGQPYPVPIGK